VLRAYWPVSSCAVSRKRRTTDSLSGRALVGMRAQPAAWSGGADSGMIGRISRRYSEPCARNGSEIHALSRRA
jgi:hypothetical protein